MNHLHLSSNLATAFVLAWQSFTMHALAQWSTSPDSNNAICIAPYDQFLPKIVSDDADGAIITWNGGPLFNEDIYAQRISSVGVIQWMENGVAICSTASRQLRPAIVADGSGGAIVTWEDSRAPNGIYAQRINALGAVQWTTNGVIISAAPTLTIQFFATIVSDREGGAIIAWKQGSGTTNGDLYAQRINESGVVQWMTNGVAICTTTVPPQRGYTIAGDGASGAIITWADERGGATNNDIYAQRINATGTVRWMTNGTAISTEANDQVGPQITSDGTGGAIIAWQDYRSGTNWDVYAQRIDSSGTVRWTANGVAICTAALYQGYPSIAPDGGGGAIITWKDYRSGTNYDIYAQRVNATGAVQWPANGVGISVGAPSIQFDLNPTIESDGSGGGIVTWNDVRISQGFDIYAQRVNAAGTVQWTPNGVVVSSAEWSQGFPAIVRTNAGGAILTWTDERNGKQSYDIYAQQVSANGNLGEITTAEEQPLQPSVFKLHQNYPNPFNPSTTIRFSVPHSAFVTLRLFNVLGEQIAILVSANISVGTHQVEWDAHNLPSGVYFYRLQAGSFIQTRKLLLLR